MSLIRIKELQEKISFSRSFIYQQISLGTFPKPIKAGKRSVAWVLEDIDQWILSRRQISCKGN